MPAILSGKVLVTGANGYIAVWVVKTLLERGFSVRGAVRSDVKGSQLQEIFKTYRERFEYVVVEDIEKEGAFDEAVDDVDGIVHTASPFTILAVEPDELIQPAVRGTTGLLVSAHKHGKHVRRVIVTSSCTAIMNPTTDSPRFFDETTWNEASVQECREKGRDANQISKYRASKTLAERAAWEWYEGHKADLRWDMVALNPSLVLGPWLHRIDKVEDLNASLNHYRENVLKGGLSKELLTTTGTSWVDVRDVAEAHMLAMMRPAAAGERIIVSCGVFMWQDLILVARRIEGDRVPEGDSTYDPAKTVYPVQYSTDKEKKLLGVHFHTLEETTRHMLHEFKCRGWWF